MAYVGPTPAASSASMRHPSLTYANVMSTLGVFIALGGTSYAVARNSIGTPQLKSGAVTSDKVRDGTLEAKDLARSVLRSVPRGPRGKDGPSGPAGPAGSAGSRGPSDARFVAPASIALSRSAGVPVNVATLDGAEAGSYLAVFMGEASYREGGAGLYVTCEIRVNGNRVSGMRGIAGDAYGGSEVLSDMVAITRSTPFDLAAACFADQTTSSNPSGPSIQSPKLALIRLDTVSEG
jgi:hypothetical protein